MIDRKHKLSVKRQAALLGISRGSVYYLPREVAEADLALMLRIDELLSNLVFEVFGSCSDLVVLCGFNSVFKFDACDDFGQIVKAA